MAGHDATPARRRHEQSSGAGALMLGLGIGGLVDGILMHQILQWHHLVSGQQPMTTMAGLEVNTLADGLFHAGALILVAGGALVLFMHWRRGRLAPGRAYLGGLLLAGVGWFNIADSVVNHWLLESHHVRDDLGGPLTWDIGFLVLAVALTGAGSMLSRRGRGRR